ncbi:MAG TPA: glycosyltransferase family 1 protein, partial [Desulfobacteraceae bacterium]|nr:glycosyltransferase family 1 protein [Desulfobacteraceae bacterium]
MRALYKIVHTSGRTGWNDPEKRILEESLWMESQGHQVVIIAPEKSPLYQKARAKGLSVYGISFKGLSRLKQSSELVEILTNEQPYVINCHGRSDGSIALKAAQKAGVPCRIISRHTGAKLKNSMQNRSIYKKLSHYVFTSSDFITDHLKDTFKLRDMDVFTIPGGIVPPENLSPKPEAAKWLA